MDDETALLKATVRKLHAERKVMHEMLTEAGIPEEVSGARTCLIGRLGVTLSRWQEAEDEGQTPTAPWWCKFGAHINHFPERYRDGRRTGKCFSIVCKP